MSPEDITTLSALLSAAQTRFNDAKEAWNEYRALVDAQDEAIAALYEFASLLVQQIRVAAKKDGTNELYQLAQIDPPKDRTPRTDAPIPTNLVTDSTTSGSIVVTFKGSKTGGVVFEVQRQLVPMGCQLPLIWQPMGTIGKKEFIDSAVPSGMSQINYRVRTVLTTGIMSEWSYPVPYFMGNGNQAPPATQASASAATAPQIDEAPSDAGGPDGLTIEDAQALKDAQTAKGKDKAG